MLDEPSLALSGPNWEAVRKGWRPGEEPRQRSAMATQPSDLPFAHAPFQHLIVESVGHVGPSSQPVELSVER